MSRANWEEVAGIVNDAAGPGAVAPAVALLVGRGDQTVFEHYAGQAGFPGHETACAAATIFDVASLTKPLVTVALTLDLVSRGQLSLDMPVAEVLPKFDSGEDARRAQVTVRDLLRHDSGLPAYVRYFETFPSDTPPSREEGQALRRRMFALAISEPLERDPRSGSVYSDVGFLVLGAVVEAVASQELAVHAARSRAPAAFSRVAELARDRLFVPLGVADATFVELVDGPSDQLLARCAATGDCEWRRRVVHGVVQDENAYAMGGVASHAGLFATARAVHALAAEWIAASQGRGRVLGQAAVLQWWNRTEAAQGAAQSTWALGWDTPTAGASSAGSRVSGDSVGHLGYTGTSIWIDRTRGVHVVLLTNRIAYGRNSDAIRALRPRLHDAVFAAIDAGAGSSTAAGSRN